MTRPGSSRFLSSRGRGADSFSSSGLASFPSPVIDAMRRPGGVLVRSALSLIGVKAC